MPILFTDLQAELGLSTAGLSKLRRDKLTDKEHFHNEGRAYFTDEGAEKLRLYKEVPLAVPTRVRGRVMRQAPNPRWVYTKLEGKDGVVPVAIPCRAYGMLIGKSIWVEIIKDASNGVTYRYDSTKG